MTQEPQAIEVEVVEIDGIVPVSRPTAAEQGPSADGGWNDWRGWQGNVRKLDSRWWPLWVFLGAIAIFLLLTVGVVLGVLFLVYSLVRGFFRMLFR